MNEKKDGRLFNYDGKAWSASFALALFSIATWYFCMSVLQLGFLKTVLVIAFTIIPLGYLYNWYAKRHGWSPLWSVDILLNLLPWDFVP